MLVALRRQQLGACYESPRRRAGERTEVLAVFLVGAGGRPEEVRAAAEPADPDLEACAVDVVAGWEFPLPGGGLGGPYLVRYAFEPAPAGLSPQVTPAGGVRPSLRHPGCVEQRLRAPAELRGAVAAVTVRLAVDGSGTPILLHAVTPAPEPVLAAITEAVRRCEWVPGADAGGRRATLWLTQTVRIDAR
jgi:hypothetical protein